MFIGLGTAVNVVAVILGSGIGVLAGHRLPHHTRDLVTAILGLITLVIGAMSIASGMSEAFTAEVGANARLLVILGSLLIGGILGSLAQIEKRLDRGAEILHDRFAARSEGSTFVEGAVTSTLVFLSLIHI